MKRGIYNMSGLALLILGLVMAFGSYTDVNAQFRNIELPKLSLTGDASGYDRDWYPDGRLRVPQSNGTPREFIVPVFIENTWDPEVTTQITDQRQGQNGAVILEVGPEEIFSFEFSVYYDSSAVRLLDVVTTGQLHNMIEENEVEDWYDPITAGWDVSTYTRKDNSYLSGLFVAPDAVDAGKGWKTTITGTSSKPLPVTFGYEVFCYLRFQAVPDITNPNTPQTALNTPLYIANDTIKYNGLNIVTTHPFDEFKQLQDAYNSTALEANLEYANDFIAGVRRRPNFFANPSEPYVGTSGIFNYDPNNANLPQPTAPGMIWIQYADELPKIQLNSDRGGSEGIVQVPSTTPRDEAERFVLTDPITTDASQQQPIFGERLLRVTNSVNGTRLRFLEIETDAEWLVLEPTNPGSGKTQGIFEISDRKLFVNFLDAGILGSSVLRDPLNNTTNDDGDLFLNIRVDPTKLNNRLDEPDTDPNDPEKAGKYVGTISFYSPDAEVSPIELEITFIYFRIPQEACERAQNIPRGIKLNMRNSNGQVGDRTSLVFGTGNRATNGVDSLFGEFAYQQDINQVQGFWARFFPVDEDGDPVQGVANNGFGDWNPNSLAPRTSSRDIRSSNAAQKSIIYYVRFDADGVANYPVVVDWDVRDFRICDDQNGDEQVGDLFLRDTENGRLFPSINMQDGTVIDQFRRSYSFQDPEIDEFIIEYTLPNVIEFVDEDGLPIIKEGWNLLSLPVNPTNKQFGVVYPNAISNAWTYEAKTYYDVRENEDLEVGRGYFIKYGQDVDVQFAGTSIREINADNFPVRVYGGDQNTDGSWNLIGSVSGNGPIEEISFSPVNGRQADVDYTLRYGVWRYVPARGYEEVSEIRSGIGYWIKADEDSFYELCVSGNCVRNKSGAESPFEDKEAVRAASMKINVADMAGREGTVYFNDTDNISGYKFGMPPVTTGVFDIRFNNDVQVTDDISNLISINGASYPVTITMNDMNAEYELFSPVTGQELGRIRPGTSDEIVIDNSNITLVGMRKLTSSAIETANNGLVNVYPNPTAQRINVSYTVETSSEVTIEVVNTVGTVIVSDNFSADANGVRQIDVNNVANGTYLVRITNGNNTVVAPITIAK